MILYDDVLKNIDLPNFEIETKQGDTKDIQTAIFETYKSSKESTKNITKFFIKKNDIDTAKAIHSFVVKNIEYKEDPDGKQYIKTPERLIYDKQGDCKSIAIFIASLFHNLGYKHGFRFVSYQKNSKRVTHIYNFFIDKNKNKIFVDGCVSSFNQPQNNFFYKEDHYMTEINKISGAVNVSDYINKPKGTFQKYDGKIIVVRNKAKIGFFGDFFASIDPTTPSNWDNLSNTLVQLDPTASWSLTSRALAWIDPTVNPITRAALSAGLAYYGVPPEMTNNVLNIMAKVGKGQIPAQELQQLLKSQGIADVEGFLKVAKSKVSDPQTQGQFDVIIQQLQKTNSQPQNLQVEFDENYYLLNNPDVAASVQRGSFTSGLDHWQQYGKREGRLGAAPLVPFQSFSPFQPNPINSETGLNPNLVKPQDAPPKDNTLMYLGIAIGGYLLLTSGKK